MLHKTTNMDWAKGPEIHPINKIEINTPIISALDNGIKLIEVIGKGAPLIKVDIVFEGGRCLEHTKLAARFVSALLREGTKSRSGENIAELLDYCGASFRSSSNMDFNYITFSCLNKHLDSVLPLITELILEPTYTENHIERYRAKSLDNLDLDLSKSELVSYREFTAALYGQDHPYGYNTTKEALANIDRKSILDQYERSFTNENAFIIVTGNPPKDIQYNLNKHLGNFNRTFNGLPWQNALVEDGQSIHINSANPYQTSIKTGRKLINRKHDDYASMFLLNTILGGYFGSRLMTSIREEKGYTYNIYSTLDPLRNDGYFYVGTEVDNEFIDPTMEAIKSEISNLQSNLIPEEELKMVKNYLSGNFLSLLDGPFAIGSILRTLTADGLDLAYFEKFYKTIQETESEDLQKLANKYLDFETFTTIVVGGIDKE